MKTEKCLQNLDSQQTNDEEFDIDANSNNDNSNDISNENSNSNDINRNDNNTSENKMYSNRKDELVKAFGSKQAQSALRKQETLLKTHDPLAAVNETDSNAFQMTKKRKDENMNTNSNGNINDYSDEDSDEDYNVNENNNNNNNNNNIIMNGELDEEYDSELQELQEPPKKKRKLDKSMNKNKNENKNKQENEEKENERNNNNNNNNFKNIFDLIVRNKNNNGDGIFSFPPKANPNRYQVYDLQEILPKYVWHSLDSKYDFLIDDYSDKTEYQRYIEYWQSEFSDKQEEIVKQLEKQQFDNKTNNNKNTNNNNNISNSRKQQGYEPFYLTLYILRVSNAVKQFYKDQEEKYIDWLKCLSLYDVITQFLIHPNSKPEMVSDQVWNSIIKSCLEPHMIDNRMLRNWKKSGKPKLIRLSMKSEMRICSLLLILSIRLGLWSNLTDKGIWCISQDIGKPMNVLVQILSVLGFQKTKTQKNAKTVYKATIPFKTSPLPKDFAKGLWTIRR